MAGYLYALGRWSFRHRLRVIGAWLLVLVVGGIGASQLAGETVEDFELPDTESSRAFDLIKERTPGAVTDGATARIVIQAADGPDLRSSEGQQVVTAALQEAATERTLAVVDPFVGGTVSPDGDLAYASVSYDRPAIDLTQADEDAVEAATQALESAGYEVVVGGDAFVDGGEAHLTAEMVGIGIAFVVLAITLGSLVAAGLPILTALIGVGIGILGVTIVGGFLDLSAVTPVLATMLGLAVGIDYALFIMSRYKAEVRGGTAPEEAAGLAVGTAGSAVVVAGLTVVIALAALSVTGIAFLAQMGLAGAATVAVAVLVALTLLPASLSLLGRRGTSGALPGLKGPDTPGRTVGRRWVDLVTRFRVPALLLGLATAVVVSLPVTKMELALPDDGSKAAETGQRQAYDLISESFGAGANGPLSVVVDVADAPDPTGAVDAAVARVSAIEKDVAAVVPPLPDPSDEQAQAFQQQLEQTGFAAITVVPESGPADSRTKELVETLRERMSGLEAETGAVPYVTGQTAAGIDLAESLGAAFPLYLAIVVGLALVLLVLVFRSVWVPLKAVLGFLVTIGMSLGATVAVFQWGWFQSLIGLEVQTPVVFLLPLLLTGILFGLAMDYEVFLVSRMREEHVHGTPARRAVVTGFQQSARVVTAAALIMVGVFAGFAFGDDPIVKSLGFSLAVGIVVDAFLVRMLLVPAVMSIVGERIWWMPRWLDRLLPRVDVEGESLTRRSDGPVPVG